MLIKLPAIEKCRLCGGHGRIVKSMLYGAAAYRVECEFCHISTEYVLVGLNGIPGSSCVSYNTPSIAKHNAVVLWNRLPIHRYSCLGTADRIKSAERRGIINVGGASA